MDLKFMPFLFGINLACIKWVSLKGQNLLCELSDFSVHIVVR